MCSLQQLKWEAEIAPQKNVEAFGPLTVIPSVVLGKQNLILLGSESDLADAIDDDVSSSDSSDSDCEVTTHVVLYAKAGLKSEKLHVLAPHNYRC